MFAIATRIWARPPITNKILIYKKPIKKSLTFSPKCETLVLSNPIGDKMPEYKIQREYTNWEQITIEADSEEEALEKAEEEDAWEYAYDVNTYNYTGEVWSEEVEYE